MGLYIFWDNNIYKPQQPINSLMEDSDKEIEELNVVCSYCKYKWKTKQQTIYATCPSCQRKTQIREMPDGN